MLHQQKGADVAEDWIARIFSVQLAKIMEAKREKSALGLDTKLETPSAAFDAGVPKTMTDSAFIGPASPSAPISTFDTFSYPDIDPASFSPPSPPKPKGHISLIEVRSPQVLLLRYRSSSQCCSAGVARPQPQARKRVQGPWRIV